DWSTSPLSLHDALPIFHVTYGATEALPIASIDAAQRPPGDTGDGTCVGWPVPGIDVRITDAPDGEVGEITVAGPTVSRRYHRLRSEEHTSELQSPYDLV